MNRIARAAAGIAVLATAASVAVVAAAPSEAASTLNITYDAKGTTHIAKPNADLSLGPTTLSARINGDGTFTGSLPLPPTQAAFNVIGFLPAKATVSFIPVGAVTGKVSTSGSATSVSATARYTIKLTNVTLGGVPTFVGDSCQTISPVTIPVSSPAGQNFNVTSGGTVSGTYSIGLFLNCGLVTPVIDGLVPGPGNTVSLTLSNARPTA